MPRRMTECLGYLMLRWHSFVKVDSTSVQPTPSRFRTIRACLAAVRVSASQAERASEARVRQLHVPQDSGDWDVGAAVCGGERRGGWGGAKLASRVVKHVVAGRSGESLDASGSRGRAGKAG
eukprot:5169463-Pleurochrysis_carterae.AAC.1